MDEKNEGVKINRWGWTPSRIFSMVLVLTSFLLSLRYNLATTPLIPTQPDILPIMLLAIGFGMMGLGLLETKEHRTLAIFILVITSLMFLLNIIKYLNPGSQF